MSIPIPPAPSPSNSTLIVGEDYNTVILNMLTPSVEFRNCTFTDVGFEYRGEVWGNDPMTALIFRHCTFKDLPDWSSLYLNVQNAIVEGCTISNANNSAIVFTGKDIDHPVNASFIGNTWNGGVVGWGAFEVSKFVNSVHIENNEFNGFVHTSFYEQEAFHFWSQSPWELTVKNNNFGDARALVIFTNMGNLSLRNEDKYHTKENTTSIQENKRYIPTATFCNNKSNFPSTVYVGGWKWSSPTYVNIYYLPLQGAPHTTDADKELHEVGIDDFIMNPANKTIPTWNVDCNFHKTFDLTSRSSDRIVPINIVQNDDISSMVILVLIFIIIIIILIVFLGNRSTQNPFSYKESNIYATKKQT